jgi:hypothetical protein
LLDRDLASRIDCSFLGPRMLTLNFQTLNNVEYFILNIFTLNNKAENDLLKNVRVKFRGKKSRYIISMHKYSVLRIQWLCTFKIRWHRFTSMQHSKQVER